ncbi:unnamed protein product [Paramecium pentaurelia]|uniref:Transmembrane protein n=1 Tax=Paramecium pentaurelia TaxID=43138 RepID=A0A8S1UX65_9CILI|nr:unnamed protein product [Paramecium pentaurelia]
MKNKFYKTTLIAYNDFIRQIQDDGLKVQQMVIELQNQKKRIACFSIIYQYSKKKMSLLSKKLQVKLHICSGNQKKKKRQILKFQKLMIIFIFIILLG